MRILIAGAGIVGNNLAEQLSEEGHDVAIVDGDAEKIRRLYLVALCRYPSLQELNGLKRVVSTTNSPRLIAFQDLFWALLNSNEFMLNH